LSSPSDVPCEISNPHHIFRDEALQRGDIHLLENDPPTANCWFYSAAIEGNGDARAEYGRSLHDGRGLPPNLPLGIRWIQGASQASSR
jgi:TPR repeat protein